MSEAGPTLLDRRLLRAAGWQDEAMAHLTQAIEVFTETDAVSRQFQPEIWTLSEG